MGEMTRVIGIGGIFEAIFVVHFQLAKLTFVCACACLYVSVCAYMFFPWCVSFFPGHICHRQHRQMTLMEWWGQRGMDK